MTRARLHRRRCLASLGALALAPWLPGCAATSRLRLGVHHWVGYETFYLARDFGWLPENVELVEGATAAANLRQLEAGTLDAVCATLDEAIGVTAAVPIRIVSVLDVSAGADRLMARPGLVQIDQLRGKRVGVETSAMGMLFLTMILEHSGMLLKDVVVVEAPLPEQAAMWQAGRLDAAVTYEPFASQLARLGAHTLFDSRKIPETIFDVLAVSRDRLGGRTAGLRAAIAAHFRALEHMRINRQDATHRFAARHAVSLEEAATAFGGVVFPGIVHNRQLLTRDSRLRDMTWHLAELMRRQGRTVPDLQPEHLFTAEFLPDEEPA